MGIFDRFTSLIARRDQAKIDPKGPLGLLPGDELSHYDTRYKVIGTRVHTRGERLVYQYRLRGEDKSIAILVAGGDVADGFALERVRSDFKVAWDQDMQSGPEDEEFRIADQGSGSVRHFGETGTTSDRMRYRVFEDEESGQILSLEEYGSAREVRLGDPVFEGELSFHGGAGPGEERAWDTEFEDCDEQAPDDADDGVSRGSPMAAAMALEGRLTSGASDPSSFTAHDATDFDDAEWADAEDVAPESGSLMGTPTGAFSDTAGWLEPTLYVDGAEHEAPDAIEDDWLTRD